MNTLTVAEIRDAEEVPPLESLYQHSIVKHPVESLLDTFNDKNYNIEELSEKSDLELSEVMSDGVEELYSILKSKVCVLMYRNNRGQERGPVQEGEPNDRPNNEDQ